MLAGLALMLAGRTIDETDEDAKERRARAAEAERRARMNARSKAEYEAKAAPIRAERARRNAENWARLHPQRQP